MEPKYQKAYAIEGIAQKWCTDNEENYVDTGDMLDDFNQILELSRELMKMMNEVQDEGDRIYLTEMSLKELLEGKIIHNDDTLIFPPKTTELGIMRSTDEKTVQLKRQVIDKEVKYALSNPPEKDELKALYNAYYQTWNKEDLQKQLAQMEDK